MPLSSLPKLMQRLAFAAIVVSITRIEAAETGPKEPNKLPSVATRSKAPPPSATPSFAELTAATVIPCNLTLAAEAQTSTNPPSVLQIATDSTVIKPAAPATTLKPDSTLSDGVFKQQCCPGNCNGSCDCCRCCQCGPPGRFWVREEYVGWWAQGGQAPVLVVTSPNDTLPATTPLYGGSTYNSGFRSGTWTQGGMWFDDCHTHGIQADYFWVGQLNSPFFARSNGDPILARPFVDATTGQPAEQLIAAPGIVVGNVGIDNYNSLQGAGVSLRCNLCCCEGCNTCCRDWCKADCSRLDFLYGFRYYNFADNLGIREQLTSIDPTSGVPIGTQINLNDSFTTQNNFYGGEIGLIYQRYYSRWMMEGTARVALGDMNSIVRINGSTVVSFPGQPTAFNEGGLYALSSNIGNYNQNNFVAIPQFSLRLGYRVTERFTLMAGYTLMYFSQIGRAADQIDTTVNPNLLPPPVDSGPDRPAYHFRPSDLVLQGITLGAELSF